jgi:hypothetical protein
MLPTLAALALGFTAPLSPTVLPLVAAPRAARSPRPLAQLLGSDGLPLGGDPPGPPPSAGGGQLLGGDGQLISGGGGGSDSAAARQQEEALLEDLADFDPSFDPLAAPRPKYDLAAASGRDDECMWGAMAAAAPAEIGSWCAHVRGAGMVRALGLFGAEELATLSPDGTAQGYAAALIAGGFEEAKIALIDPRVPGARQAALSIARAADAAKEFLCVHCTDGNSLSSVIMAEWILTDYIGAAANATQHVYCGIVYTCRAL